MIDAEIFSKLIKSNRCYDGTFIIRDKPEKIEAVMRDNGYAKMFGGVYTSNSTCRPDIVLTRL